jgi:hypothetical protein
VSPLAALIDHAAGQRPACDEKGAAGGEETETHGYVAFSF